MPTCVIVIPVHNESPSANELLAFRQCFNVLKAHPIRVLAPQNLNVEKYRAAVSNFEIIFIDPVWQASLQQYNQLKVSPFFYSLFKEYDYLLTYELDAYVFKDELEYWCNKEMDYIGAPWFEGLASPVSTNIIGVGNSGFSLRNVQSSIRILRRIILIKRLRAFWFKTHLQALVNFSSILSGLKGVFHISSLKVLNILLFDNAMNEDFYWTKFVSLAFTDYKPASIEEACKFSFDVNPSFLFNKNENHLPFGCHGWEKYEPEFWKQYIPIQP